MWGVGWSGVEGGGGGGGGRSKGLYSALQFVNAKPLMSSKPTQYSIAVVIAGQ